jgi:hypothetical protein
MRQDLDGMRSSFKNSRYIPGYQGHIPQANPEKKGFSVPRCSSNLIENIRFDLPGYTGHRPRFLLSNTGFSRGPTPLTTSGRDFSIFANTTVPS